MDSNTRVTPNYGETLLKKQRQREREKRYMAEQRARGMVRIAVWVPASTADDFKRQAHNACWLHRKTKKKGNT